MPIKSASKPALNAAYELNKHLLTAPSLTKLEELIMTTPVDVFNSVNLATALGLLQKRRSTNKPALEKLLRPFTTTTPQLPGGIAPTTTTTMVMGSRELSTICYSLALGSSSHNSAGWVDTLPPTLTNQLLRSDLTKFTPQAVSMCVYAIAHFHQLHALPTYTAVASRLANEVVRRGLSAFPQQQSELATLVRGFAVFDSLCLPQLVCQLADGLSSSSTSTTASLARLTERTLASLIWSTARLSGGGGEVSSSSLVLVNELLQRGSVEGLRPNEVPKLVWALGRLTPREKTDDKVQRWILCQVPKVVPKFSLRDVAQLMPALQSTGRPLLDVLCDHVCQLVPLPYSTKDLVSVVHSLAQARHKHVGLLELVSREFSSSPSSSRLRGMANAEFALMLHALAKFREMDELAMGGSAGNSSSSKHQEEEAAFVEFSWRKMVHMERPLVAALANEFAHGGRGSSSFPPDALVSVLTSLNKLDAMRCSWSQVVEQDLARPGRLAAFSPRALSQLCAALVDIATASPTSSALALASSSSSRRSPFPTLIANELARRGGLAEFNWRDLSMCASSLVGMSRSSFPHALFTQELMQERRSRTWGLCSAQDLATLLRAFASARVLLDDDVVWHGAVLGELERRSLAEFPNSSLASVLLSLAQYTGSSSLSSSPRRKTVVARLAQEASRRRRHFSPQELCNVMYALACMDEFGEFFQGDDDAAAAGTTRMRTVEAAQQLLMTRLAWTQHQQQHRQDEDDAALLPPLFISCLGDGGEEWAEALVKCDTFRSAPSLVQDACTRMVGQALQHRRSSIKYQREALLESCLLVDVYIPAFKCCIEVNGPSHYLSDGKTPTGRWLFKTSLLKRAGYRVFAVHAGKFQGLATAEEQSREMFELAAACCSRKTKQRRSSSSSRTAAAVGGVNSVWEEV